MPDPGTIDRLKHGVGNSIASADDFRIPVQALRVISATKPHDPGQPVELGKNRKLGGRAELRGGSERDRRPLSVRQHPNS